MSTRRMIEVKPCAHGCVSDGSGPKACLGSKLYGCTSYLNKSCYLANHRCGVGKCRCACKLCPDETDETDETAETVVDVVPVGYDVDYPVATAAIKVKARVPISRRRKVSVTTAASACASAAEESDDGKSVSSVAAATTDTETASGLMTKKSWPMFVASATPKASAPNDKEKRKHGGSSSIATNAESSVIDPIRETLPAGKKQRGTQILPPRDYSPGQLQTPEPVSASTRVQSVPGAEKRKNRDSCTPAVENAESSSTEASPLVGGKKKHRGGGSNNSASRTSSPTSLSSRSSSPTPAPAGAEKRKGCGLPPAVASTKSSAKSSPAVASAEVSSAESSPVVGGKKKHRGGGSNNNASRSSSPTGLSSRSSSPTPTLLGGDDDLLSQKSKANSPIVIARGSKLVLKQKSIETAVTVAKMAAERDGDTSDEDEVEKFPDVAKLVKSHALEESEIRLRMDHTAVCSTDEKTTVNFMAHSLARTLEEEGKWVVWIYSFLLQLTEEGHFSPASNFYEQIDLFVGNIYNKIVESTREVIAKKDAELAEDDSLRAKRRVDKTCLSLEESAILGRNSSKMAKIRATVHRAIWRSMRGSSYPYYMLFLLAILPTSSSSSWSAEEHAEHEVRCNDLAGFSLQDREEGARVLQERPMLADCLRSLNRAQVRELVISAGTYSCPESYRQKIQNPVHLADSKSYRLAVQNLLLSSGASGMGNARITYTEPRKKRRKQSSESDGDKETKHPPKSAKKSADSPKKVFGKDKKASNNSDSEPSESDEERKPPSKSAKKSVDSPKKSSEKGKKASNSDSESSESDEDKKTPSNKSFENSKDFSDKIKNSTNNDPVCKSPPLFTTKSPASVKTSLPPDIPASLPSSIMYSVKPSQSTRECAFEAAAYCEKDEDEDQIGAVKDLKGRFCSIASKDDTAFQTIGKAATAELFRRSKKVPLVLIPQLHKQFKSTGDREEPAVTHILLKKEQRGDKFCRADLLELFQTKVEFSVCLRTKLPEENYHRTAPDGMCFWRILWQLYQRAHGHLSWSEEETYTHDVNLLDESSVSLFLTWMRRMRDGLQQSTPTPFSKFMYDKMEKQEIIRKMDGVIAHIIANKDNPKMLPREFWGCMHYLEYFGLVPDLELYFPAQILTAIKVEGINYGVLGANSVRPTGLDYHSTYTACEIRDILRVPNFAMYYRDHFCPGPPVKTTTEIATSFYNKRENHISDALELACDAVWDKIHDSILPELPTIFRKPKSSKADLQARLKKLQDEMQSVAQELASLK